jgi:phosphoenolpyruvate synthase/pyruvate phosphate dikinase
LYDLEKEQNIMYEKVDSSLDFVPRELEVLSFWKDNNIFEKSVEIRENAPIFSFFDGPPTAHLDRLGVGKLMRIAVDLGRKAKPELELGICGEHGGDPYSVEFCQILGLDYVSCSPFRVPIARLAAAQSALRYPRES